MDHLPCKYQICIFHIQYELKELKAFRYYTHIRLCMKKYKSFILSEVKINSDFTQLWSRDLFLLNMYVVPFTKTLIEVCLYLKVLICFLKDSLSHKKEMCSCNMYLIIRPMTMDLSLQILPLTMTHDDLYEALRNESTHNSIRKQT